MLKSHVPFVICLVAAGMVSHADASVIRLRHATGSSPTPTPTPTPTPPVIPSSQTVYEGALTLPGQGPNIQYAGTPGHLSIISATGNGETINRLNGCSQLVRGGNVTATLNGVSVTNAGYAYINSGQSIVNATRSAGTIASSYDYTVQDSDTGQTGTIHVVMSGNLTVAGGTVLRPVQGNGFIRTYSVVVPDHIIDLAHTRTISAYPTNTTACPGATNDYPNQQLASQFLTGGGGNTADGLQAAFADTTAIALNDAFLIEAGSYNLPYVGTDFPTGTIDFAINVNMPTPTGTWSGTAPDYDDGPWVNVLFHDRLNTHMGEYYFTPSTPTYTSIEGGVWDAPRAQLYSYGLGAKTGTSSFTSSSSKLYGSIFIGRSGGGYAGSFVRAIYNVFDPSLPAGETVEGSDNFTTDVVARLDGAAASDSIIIKNNLFEHHYVALNQIGNVGIFTTNLVLRNNFFTGLGIDDTVDSTNTCAYNVTGNYFAGQAVPAGSHPDLFQGQSNGVSGTASCPIFGTFSQNMATVDDYGIDGTGNPAPGWRLDSDEEPQFLFFNTSTTVVRNNFTARNNVYNGGQASCISIDTFNTAVIDHNSCILDLKSTNFVAPTLSLHNSSNIVATNNVISSSAVSDVSPGTGNSYNTTTNKNILNVQSGYSTYWQSPDVTQSCHTYACVVSSWSAKVGGPLDGTATNGTAIGAIDTTGGFPTGP